MKDEEFKKEVDKESTQLTEKFLKLTVGCHRTSAIHASIKTLDSCLQHASASEVDYVAALLRDFANHLDSLERTKKNIQ